MSESILKSYAIIPARSGSKGLPGKNTKLIAGMPLICWTIKAAISAQCFERIIVSTDSPEIALIATAYGAEVPFLRPAELAQDGTRTVDVVTHLIRKLALSDEDRICLLQPTSPLREASDITASLKLMNESRVSSVISVVRFKMAADWLMTLDENQRLVIPPVGSATSNRQEAKPCFFPNGAIYWCDVKGLWDTNGFLVNPVAAFEMEPWKSVDIDHQKDFEVAEHLLKIQLNTGPRIR